MFMFFHFQSFKHWGNKIYNDKDPTENKTNSPGSGIKTTIVCLSVTEKNDALFF